MASTVVCLLEKGTHEHRFVCPVLHPEGGLEGWHDVSRKITNVLGPKAARVLMRRGFTMYEVADLPKAVPEEGEIPVVLGA